MGKILLKTHTANLKDNPLEYRWYTLKVNHNYEAEAKRNIINNMTARGFGNYIKEIIIPIVEREVETVDKKGNTKIKVKREKVYGYDGYIWINMILTEITWGIVRNSTGVATWLDAPGDGSPQVLTRDELENIRRVCETPAEPVEYKIGAEVNIVSGVAKGMNGKIIEISSDKKEVKIEMENGMKFDLPSTQIELTE